MFRHAFINFALIIFAKISLYTQTTAITNMYANSLSSYTPRPAIDVKVPITRNK